MRLFLFQFHTLLTIRALQYGLKSGSLIPIALFLLLKIALAKTSLGSFLMPCECYTLEYLVLPHDPGK